jgi:multidrug efflux pump subunit AcrA (membrane-fusion protein)
MAKRTDRPDAGDARPFGGVYSADDEERAAELEADNKQMADEAHAREQLDKLNADLEKRQKELDEREAKVAALEAERQRAAANAGSVGAAGTVTADHTNQPIGS